MKKQQKRVRFSHIIGITFFLIILIGLLPLKLKGNNLGEVYAKTNQKKLETGDTVVFGSYPQSKVVDESLINILDNLDLDSNDNVTYKKQKYRKKSDVWYKYEPIEWTVLEGKDSNVFVISKKVLDVCKIDDNRVYWKDSHARKWLNKTFYQEAFSKKDRSYIKLSSVKNNCSQNNTQDYLFYPSV